MHCYSCPTPLGAKPFLDKETGRFYCETCREIIWGVIMEQEKKSNKDPKKDPFLTIIGTGETELLPEEFDMPDFEEDDYEPLDDDNWEERNFPVDED